MDSLPRKVLVTGANGQLAGSLLAAAPSGVTCVPLGRLQLDITDRVAVRAAFELHRPEAVINGAAYNLVDKAEGEGARAALEINALGVTILAQVAREFEARLVHFSTDFVFDGRADRPYRESDATGPLGVYAASKLCGENIALAADGRNLAIRVSRLFGPVNSSGAGSAQKPSGNFPQLMLRLGRERGMVRVVDDQVGSPSYTPDLARGTWELLQVGARGLFHLSNAGEVDFASYAEEIFRLGGVAAKVERISSREYNAPALRPAYSTLSNEKAHGVGVKPLRAWQDALRDYLSQD